MISSQLRGGNITFLDCIPDLLPAFRRGDFRISLERFGFRREIGVFDHSTEPLGVVASMHMEQPRLIIHAVGKLQKHSQVLCAEIQFSVQSLEVETLFRTQCAFGVLPTVTTALPARLFSANPER